MAKRDDFASFEEAEVSSQIATKVALSVFNNEFKHLQKRLERQESQSLNIMIGAVVALFLIAGGLMYQGWVFMAEYNQHYLAAEKSFQDDMLQMRLEHSKLEQMFRVNEEKKATPQTTNE